MQPSQKAIDLIKKFEGLVLYLYTDAAGYPTIGYGHKCSDPLKAPCSITEQQAQNLLMADLSAVAGQIDELVHVELNQGQFDALCSFCYNLGYSALKYSTLLRLLNAGNYDEAASEFLKWDHVDGIEVAGLKARRQAEHDLFIS